MEFVKLPVSSLDPNPDNVNKMDDTSFKDLVAHIVEVGVIDPVAVVAVDGRYMILDGEHRWKAVKEIGHSEIACIVLSGEQWKDKDSFDLSSFKMNNIRGSQDPEQFAKLYTRLATKYGAESLQKVFAVSDKALWKKFTKNLLKGTHGVPNEAVKEMMSGLDESSIETMDSGVRKRVKKSKVVVAGNDGMPALVITATDKTMSSIGVISNWCALNGKNINEVFESILVDYASKLMGNKNGQ